MSPRICSSSLPLPCLSLVLLGVASGPVPWLVIVLANTHSYFIHSSARLNIGPLRYLLCDNRFHRIHHSREQRHIDHNFATSTPLWDVLFGTADFLVRRPMAGRGPRGCCRAPDNCRLSFDALPALASSDRKPGNDLHANCGIPRFSRRSAGRIHQQHGPVPDAGTRRLGQLPRRCGTWRPSAKLSQKAYLNVVFTVCWESLPGKIWGFHVSQRFRIARGGSGLAVRSKLGPRAVAGRHKKHGRGFLPHLRCRGRV